MSKHPPNIYTVCIFLGPNVAPFQQHFTDARKAGNVLATLKARMIATEGKCIEGLQLWYKGTMVSSYVANPPIPAWLPPPDEFGVRHIPAQKSGLTSTVKCLADYRRLGPEGAGKVLKGTKASRAHKATLAEISNLDF
jgi:hypothetical protein